MKRPALLLTALLGALFLAACGNDAAAPAAGDSADSAATATDGTPSAEAQAAAASAAAAAGASVAGTEEATIEAPGEAPPAPAADADPSALVEGRDYEVIPNGQPWLPLNGKVEVVEVFGYVCPACARIEPLFTAW